MLLGDLPKLTKRKINCSLCHTKPTEGHPEFISGSISDSESSGLIVESI